jgi:site-specific recombinase XerD
MNTFLTADGLWQHQHVERLRAADRSPRTIASRLIAITSFRRYCDGRWTEVTLHDLATWLATPGWSKATRSVYRYHLRAWFQWLHAEGHIDSDPSQRLEVVRVAKRMQAAASPAAVAELMRRAQQHRPRYYGYFLLAGWAGLRCEEIARLDWADITEEHITVWGKGSKPRLVETHPSIWAWAQTKPRSGRVCHFDSPDPIVRAKSLSRGGSHILTRLGYPALTMHQLRRWFATTTYRGTGNLRAVQLLLGHSSIATTERYIAVDEGERRRAVCSLPPAA